MGDLKKKKGSQLQPPQMQELKHNASKQYALSPYLSCSVKLGFVWFSFPVSTQVAVSLMQGPCLTAALLSRLPKHCRTWEPTLELPSFQLCK